MAFPIVKLAERYKRQLDSGRVLSLHASISVVRDRIAQLAERIDENHAPDRLTKLAKLWAEYLEADRNDSPDRFKLKRQISDGFDAATTDFAAWSQMLEAVDLDRKLVESEVKVYKDMRALLTAEDAYKLIAKLLAIILRIFPDDSKKLMQVQYEFARLIGDKPIEPEGLTIDVED